MADPASAPVTPRRSTSELRRHVRQFLRRPTAVFGLVLVLGLLGAGLLAPWVAPYDPDARFASKTPPSAEHWFGTDVQGRDLFSGVLHGARVTLMIGLISVGIGLSAGLVLGSVSAYAGGRVDLALQRIIDVMMSFPSMLLAILIVALTDDPSLKMAMVAVGIVAIPTYTRLVRAAVLQQREQEYVLASQAIGASPVRILVRGILPNTVAPLLVQSTLGFATAILEAAGLSFLGLGAKPPTKEWGLMVRDGWDYWGTSPWLITFPGACIFLAVLSLNLLGDGLRDVLDPRMRGSR